MKFDWNQEHELERYCVARFSSEGNDDLVRDLMSVAFTVKTVEVCARVERVNERLRSRNPSVAAHVHHVDRESAKARFDRLQE